MTPPPPHPVPTASPHPRRPPAHRSVSLLHREGNSAGSRGGPPQPPTSPTQKVASANRSGVGTIRLHSSAHQQQQRHRHHQHRPKDRSPLAITSVSPENIPGSIPTGEKNSSGESSNADHWFDKANNNVTISQGSNTFMDDEPPYFLRNPSSSDTPPEATSGEHSHQVPLPSYNHHALPYRASMLMPGGTDGSSTEDFRSVIDDLTVENKKLKRKLKRYQKLHDTHLQDDKLFEVRLFGLSGAKKKQFEEMMRTFALSLDGSNPSGSPAPRFTGFAPALDSHKTTSSHASHPFADSAYASASASGQGGSSGTGGPTPMQSEPQRRKVHPRHQHQTQQHDSITSYLHDIPEGLMPRHPVVMTEKAKCKLVVRRLEQIFAGKGAAIEGHQQPIQQQEVSQLAAKADRSAIEARGQQASAEGVREARILPTSTDEAMEGVQNTDAHSEQAPPSANTRSITTTQATPALPAAAPTPGVVEVTGKRSPDQRPTRPLDLDPFRAQVPAENIQYIRHLGFSPPDAETMGSPLEGRGWIYLNLLINMAQLHTLNVTTEFVKKALSGYSDRLELSSDGRKVRWRGGRAVTKRSSDGSSPGDSETGTTPANARGATGAEMRGSKRIKLAHKAAGTAVIGDPQPSKQRLESIEDKFAYTPLFFHRDESDSEMDSSMEDGDDTPESAQQAYGTGDSSNMMSSGMRTSSSRKKKQDDGPMIFYSKAKFCTDLSGDRRAALSNMKNFESYSKFVLGSPFDNIRAALVAAAERKGPLSRAAFNDTDSEDTAMEISPESRAVLNFPDSPLHMAATSNSDVLPIDFEASGLGGVSPVDNFMVLVQNQQIWEDITEGEDAPSKDYAAKGSIGYQLTRLISRPPPKHVLELESLSTKVRQLPPSTLPPASCLPIESSYYDSDDDDDNGSQVSDVPIDSLDRSAPTAAPQLFYVPSHSESSDAVSAAPAAVMGNSAPSSPDPSSSEDDADSDSSLDLLATARQLDPAAVRAREREYDANIADRLAEEIPAGSSAATAGGGSGFNSPAVASDDAVLRKAEGLTETSSMGPAGMGAMQGVRRGKKRE